MDNIKKGSINLFIFLLFIAGFSCMFLNYDLSWIPGTIFMICSIVWGIKFYKELTNQVDTFDKKLSASISQQLSLLFSLVAIVFLLATGAILCFQPDFKEIELDSSISSFIHIAHRYIGYNFYDDNILLNSGVLILSVFGTLLLGGLLITTFSNIVQQKKENYLSGNIEYKLEDHFVFLGFNEVSISICKEVLSKCNSRAIILTNQRITLVRSVLKSRLNELYERIILYSGNIDENDNLKRLCLDTCKEVYLLGEQDAPGHDSICLTTVKKICILLNDDRKDLLRVYMQMDSSSAFSITQKLDVPESYTSKTCGNGQTKKLIELHPFNLYENQARKLWGYYKDNAGWDLDYSDLTGPTLLPGSKKRVNLVIAGFDRMGQALLLEALRICHYPNYSEDETRPVKTLITVLDKNMDNIWPQFEAKYPHVADIKDIEIQHYSESLESPFIRSLLETYASNENELLTVAICFWDPDNSFSAGLSLPESLYFYVKDNAGHNNNHVRILIRNEFNSGIKDVISGDSARYKNVRFFGSIEDGLSEKLLDDKAAILQGAHFDTVFTPTSNKQLIYDQYIKLIEQLKDSQKKTTNSNSILNAYKKQLINANDTLYWARLFWNETSENHKCSNRYQIEMYGIYSKYLTALKESIMDKAEELMSQMEHRRWCAERYIMGYRHEEYEPGTDIKKQKDLWRVHSDLVPFSKLSDKEKAKDLVHLTIDTINEIIKTIDSQ